MQKNIKLFNYLSILIATILAFLTLYFGKLLFNDKYFYISSLLIIIYALIPFLFMYENKKPRAREIMVIASMTTIAVISRVIFFFIPQFKPMSAVVIISGTTLGPQAGFLIGLLSAFISNFFYGQGPYTLYQMIALGIIGTLSGFMWSDKKINKITLSLFGFLSVFIIYGGIVNTGTLFMLTTEININSIITIFATGLPFDLIHAVSTVIFLYFLANPFKDKLSRLKVKYGILKTSYE